MEAFQTKGKHAPSSRREEEGLCGCSIECEKGTGWGWGGVGLGCGEREDKRQQDPECLYPGDRPKEFRF